MRDEDSEAVIQHTIITGEKMSHEILARVANGKLIHVTTLGRRTTKPHLVELWFAVNRGRVYLSHEGEETDWMKNIKKHGDVSFEIDGRNFTGTARLLENNTEAWEGKVALYEKYYGEALKETIEDWFSLSKLVLIELHPAK
jgi:deazaflavin-dependent oxidoreductase (nitroreductase family)